MSGRTVIIVLLLALAVYLAFMIGTAALARKESNHIRAQFDSVNHSIEGANQVLDEKNLKVSAMLRDSSAEPVLILSLTANNISLRLDTMGEELHRLDRTRNGLSQSYNNMGRVAALRTELLAFDSLIVRYFADSAGIGKDELIKLDELGDLNNIRPQAAMASLQKLREHVFSLEVKAFGGK